MISDQELKSLTEQFEKLGKEHEALSASIAVVENDMDVLSGKIEKGMVARGLNLFGEPLSTAQRKHLIEKGWVVGTLQPKPQ